MGKVLRPRRGKKSTAISQLKSGALGVLANGEVFFELPDGGAGKGEGRIIMGDGNTAYENLPAFIDPSKYVHTGSTENEKVTFTETSSTDNAALLKNIVSGASLKNLFPSVKNLLSNLNSSVTKLNNDLKSAKTNISSNTSNITKLSNGIAYISKVFTGSNGNMIYWQRCQSEIASALGTEISKINMEKMYITAYNADWDAFQGGVEAVSLQWDRVNLNLNIQLSASTGGTIRINFMIIYHESLYM